MSFKTALITGITGQDGTYLAEWLLAKAYKVVGATRFPENATANLAATVRGNIELVRWDPADQKNIADILAIHRPHEFYNFGAYSSGAGMFDDAVSIGDVNGLAVTRMLEAIREVDSSIRFCQASSSEMFGEASESPQSEQTAFNPRSPYGAAKLYAHAMLRIYRQRYGLFACSAILFNHESPRRGLGFVTRKVCREAVRIKLGLAQEVHLGNLEVRRDWGYSGDYARAMWLMLQQSEADDFVLATGQLHSVRELCECAFSCLGLDYRKYVREDAAMYRPAEAVPLVGNPEKAKRMLNWRPEVSFREMIAMMVDADLAALTKKSD